MQRFQRIIVIEVSLVVKVGLERTVVKIKLIFYKHAIYDIGNQKKNSLEQR